MQQIHINMKVGRGRSLEVQKWKKTSELQGMWAEGGEINREPENFQGQDGIREPRTSFLWL